VRRLVALLVGFALLTLSACAGPAPSQLTIYAAASLTNVSTALSAAWSADHPDVSLTFSTGSSAALRIQIEQGAPADVFLSADTDNAQTLVGEGLAPAPVTAFATNSLIVVVPSANPARVFTPVDLGRPGVCVIAAGEEVPITRYAEQMVAQLAALPGYGADFAARYEANVCSREDNVAAVVSKIGLGEGDAAIVYATDAAASAANLTTFPIPATANVVATYGAVVVGGSPHAASAREFLAWLIGPRGQAVLSQAGFGSPTG
jgi:molybdate transport system substrate-binding protein